MWVLENCYIDIISCVTRDELSLCQEEEGVAVTAWWQQDSTDSGAADCTDLG